MDQPSWQRHVLPADLAAELRVARLRLGLGLRQLERLICISRGYLSRLERGERCPSVVVAEALAVSLKLDSSVRARLLELARPDAGARADEMREGPAEPMCMALGWRAP